MENSEIMRALVEGIAIRGEMIARMMAGASGADLNFKPFDQLVSEMGVVCGPLQKADLKDKEPRACFHNAWCDLSEAGDPWLYCEGFAMSGDIPIPIHHAWLVDPETLAVRDRTPVWSQRSDTAYFGIPFKTDYVLQSSVETGWPSPLFRGEIYRPEIASLPASIWHGAPDKLNREGSAHKLNREGGHKLNREGCVQ